MSDATCERCGKLAAGSVGPDDKPIPVCGECHEAWRSSPELERVKAQFVTAFGDFVRRTQAEELWHRKDGGS